MLLALRSTADNGAVCVNMYLALAAAVKAAADDLLPEDVAALADVFQVELRALEAAAEPAAARPPAAAHRLRGRLVLVDALWALFLEPEMAAAAPPPVRATLASDATLRLLLDQLLFPEADVCTRMRDDPGAVLAAPVAALQAALSPAAPTTDARRAAYVLATTIVRGSDSHMTACLRRLLAMLGPGPCARGVLQLQYADHMDPRGAVSDGRWRGLKSTGATCYMNAVVQQLFCQPTIRELVLRAPAVADTTEEKDAVFSAMQVRLLFVISHNEGV